MDYKTFKLHLDNLKVLYVSKFDFESEEAANKFVLVMNDDYFKNWDKLYVHTTLLYKYQDKYYASPLMFNPLPKSPKRMPELANIMIKHDLQLIYDE